MFRIKAAVAALLVTGVLAGCSSSMPESPAAAEETLSAAAARQPTVLGMTSTTTHLGLGHWGRGKLDVTLSPLKKLRGTVSLRLERADGAAGDVIEVSPSTVTLSAQGATFTTLTLRPTRLAYPAPAGAQSWRLVASQGGRMVGSMTIPITLSPVQFSFRFQPVTAREGQTVEAVLIVDADTHGLPPFSFSLSPYIPDEISEYELLGDPLNPARYQVNTLPATFRVPVLFKTFRTAQTPPTQTAFELSVGGLSTLGSAAYGPRLVRADLRWNLAP